MPYSNLSPSTKDVSTARIHTGFTLIELTLVLVLVGILAAIAIPKYADLERQARIASVNNVAGSMKAAISIVQSKARAQGLSAANANPGGIQTSFLVTTDAGTAEVDWRNLCPESQAEGGDQLDMIDFISVGSTDSQLQSRIDNQFTRVGPIVPAATAPQTSGCYVLYDSFGSPNCTVTVYTTDC